MPYIFLVFLILANLHLATAKNEIRQFQDKIHWWQAPTDTDWLTISGIILFVCFLGLLWKNWRQQQEYYAIKRESNQKSDVESGV